MAKQGVWGDQMRIIVPVLYKRVTCATCCNYCHDDHSCLVKPVVPQIDGYDYWKRCDAFALASEYNDDMHRAQVRRIKGEQFVQKKPVKIAQNTDSNECKNMDKGIDVRRARRPANVLKEPRSFSDRFIATAWLRHELSLSEVSVPLLPGIKDIRLFVNTDVKMIVITMPKVSVPPNKFGKAMTSEQIRTRLWSSFCDKVSRIIQIIDELRNVDYYEKWIVMPVIQYKDNYSCGEIFYQTNGKALHGIKLVEMSENGELLFATGPIYEKYWTSERIHNLNIFKEI